MVHVMQDTRIFIRRHGYHSICVQLCDSSPHSFTTHFPAWMLWPIIAGCRPIKRDSPDAGPPATYRRPGGYGHAQQSANHMPPSDHPPCPSSHCVVALASSPRVVAGLERDRLLTFNPTQDSSGVERAAYILERLQLRRQLARC